MIGSFRRLGIVARTPTATVWKAVDTALGRTVALKQVVDPGYATAARREAEMLVTLRHPNIIRIFDFFEDAKGAWLVEQWVDGAPLRVVADRTGRLSVADSLALLRGALEGLAHAHAQRVVHGDVTPRNILIDAAGSAILVDFGIARAAGHRGVGGTPGYAAPEALQGDDVDPRADVYSACVVLAELLRAAMPFHMHTAAATIADQLRGAPVLDGIDNPIAEVLRRGLSLVPDDRPADAAELLAMLDAAAEQSQGRDWRSSAALGTVGAAAATIALGLGVTETIAGSSSALGTATAQSGGPAPTGNDLASTVPERPVHTDSGSSQQTFAESAARSPRTARSTPSRRLLFAGAAVGVVAIGFVVVVLSRPDDPGARDTSAAAPTSSVALIGAPESAASPTEVPAMFSGQYTADFPGAVGTATITSDCATCPVTVSANGTTTVLQYDSGRWITVATTPCGVTTITVAPVDSADGFAQTLSHHATATSCSGEVVGTWTRVG